MNWHSMPLKDILEKLSTDQTTGLSEQQAKEALAKHGENKLEGKKSKTLAQRFIEQFKDFMVIILLIAAVISLVVAINGHDKTEFLEPFIIIGIVIINATMGVMQESRAEKALEALQNMAAPLAKVLRGGTVHTIPASEVVPGDICVLEAGDFIPADGRLLEAASLKVEESALTGESVPAEKEIKTEVAEGAPLGDRHNMVFSGCSVSYGRGKMVVVETAMGTQMGKIASMLNDEEEEPTPLQQRLSELGKILGIAALGICFLIFILGIIDGLPIMEIFISSVSLAVAAIPEGLPAIVTIVLAIGVQRMVSKNAIVRQLPAVETLGSASVICSDKTGTLTQNRMKLMETYTEQSGIKTLEESGTVFSGDDETLMKYAILCCDGKIETDENGAHRHIGDPTETAIVFGGLEKSIAQETINQSCPRIGEIPFDSERKLMTTVNMIDGKRVVIVKGAFDVLAKLCVSGNIEKAAEANENMGRRALRVISVAYKVIDSLPEEYTTKDLENGLTFIGLVGMIDPPRPEAAEAVKTCKKAGIRVVMITGDHVLTATAIAKEIGIYEEGNLAVTGQELQQMSEEELAKIVLNCTVYARVSPEDKIRIVKAWQAQGHVVSMTGDGVNDAPALKAADIGCAMGITGTDVAKGAANMILTDDNFATIVDAVKEGRGIYDNITKAVKFLVSCNIGEIFTMLFAMLIWQDTPLAAIHLLWVNLVTDSLPALALGVEPVPDSIMDRKPIPKNAGIFTKKVVAELLLQGTMFGVLTSLAYYIGLTNFGVIGGQTMAFLTLAITQLFHAFNERSEHSILKIGIFSNKAMIYAVLTSALLIVLVACIPAVSALFSLLVLPAKFYMIVLGLAFVPVIVMETYKAIFNRA